MRNFPILIIAYCMLLLTLFFGSSVNFNLSKPEKSITTNVSEEEEQEDGIREAQEMEFEMTKDPRLGYVPMNRLVNAYNKVLTARRSGRLARSTSGIVWQERGPNINTVGSSNGNQRGPQNTATTAGRMRAIWLDLNDPTGKTVWAGSVSGGLWKTTNITATNPNWIVVDDFIGNQAVTSITQDPVQKNILYFGTGERNGNFDAVRGGGIWKSIDNGVTWNLLPNTVGFWNISKIACDAAGNIYVGTNGNGAGLQRSRDGGATWSNITPFTTGNGNRISELRYSSTGRMHVTISSGSANNSGYFYTDDPANVTRNGWIPPLTPFQNVEHNCELSVTGNTLYALPSTSSFLTPQIYKSVDGGLNWFATPTSPPGSTASEPTINSGQGFYNLAIGADPRNPDIVIAGGLNFYRSTDGGVTWTQLTRWVGTSFNYVHADHHGVVWFNDQVLVATDGGIFYSSNNAVSFLDRNTGLRTKQFYSCAIHPTSTNYFLGGTQDNGIHQFTQAGLGNTVEVLGGDGGFCHIDDDEPQFQFAATTRANYRRSTNGGSSWSQVSNTPSEGIFINPTEYDDVENVMYTSAAAGNFIRWENPQSGSTFTSVILTTGVGAARSFCVSRFTRNRVFVGFEGGRILRVDNAKSQNPQVSIITGTGMPNNIVSSINTGSSDLQLIATYTNYGVPHVWVSTTGGGTGGWTNVTGNLPDIPVRWGMFFPEDNNKAMIATEMGVYETDQLNGSSTVWVLSSGFPTVKTNMLHYRSTDRTILAATHGRGFWTAQFPITNPVIRFPGSYMYGAPLNENNSSQFGCRRYRDYQIPLTIDAAPDTDAIVQIEAVNSGTAVKGADFDFSTNGDFTTPSSSLVFPQGSTQSRTFTLRIYDDATVEQTETFSLKISVANPTNAKASLTYGTYTYTIADNDPEPQQPTFSGEFNIGFYDANLSTTSPFRSNVARNRVQYIYTAAELKNAGINGAGLITGMSINVAVKNSTRPYNNFTISLAPTTSNNLNDGYRTISFVEVYSGNYSSVAGVNQFNFSTPFSWDGTSNLVVNICFDNSTGTPDAQPDLVAGTQAPLGSGNRASVFPSNLTGSGCSIIAGSVNDPIADTRMLGIFQAGNGNEIATLANTADTEFVPASQNVLFISGQRILSRLSNADSDLGCTTVQIREAGNDWSVFFAGQRSQKVFALNSDNPGVSYRLSLYLTAAELQGRNPSGLNIAGTAAATASESNAFNTTVYATTFQNYENGFIFTANVSGPGLFYLSTAFVTGVSGPADIGMPLVRLMENPVGQELRIMLMPSLRDNLSLRVFNAGGQYLQGWKLGSVSGIRYLPLSTGRYPAGIYFLEIITGNRQRELIRFVKQ